MSGVESIDLDPVPLSDGYQMERVIAGCWQLAHGHRLAPLDQGVSALEKLELCYERGIRTFDCADIYTGVEELLGNLRRHLGPRRAAELRIHSKYVPDLQGLAKLRRHHVRLSIERSLERLRAPRIDLVQFHWWDFDIASWRDVAGWLAELVDEGKIGRLGLTNFDEVRLNTLLDDGIPVRSNQVQYSLLDRRPGGALAQLCRRRHVALIAYGTLAGGLLTSRFATGSPPNRDENRSQTKYQLIIDELGGWVVFQQLLTLLQRIADARGVDLAAVATGWVLLQPSVASAIVGVGATRQPDPRAIGEVEFTCEELDAITELLKVIGAPRGAVYELERDRDGRHGRIMRYDLHES